MRTRPGARFCNSYGAGLELAAGDPRRDDTARRCVHVLGLLRSRCYRSDSAKGSQCERHEGVFQCPWRTAQTGWSRLASLPARLHSVLDGPAARRGRRPTARRPRCAYGDARRPALPDDGRGQSAEDEEEPSDDHAAARRRRRPPPDAEPASRLQGDLRVHDDNGPAAGRSGSSRSTGGARFAPRDSAPGSSTPRATPSSPWRSARPASA